MNYQRQNVDIYLVRNANGFSNACADYTGKSKSDALRSLTSGDAPNKYPSLVKFDWYNERLHCSSTPAEWPDNLRIYDEDIKPENMMFPVLSGVAMDKITHKGTVKLDNHEWFCVNLKSIHFAAGKVAKDPTKPLRFWNLNKFQVSKLCMNDPQAFPVFVQFRESDEAIELYITPDTEDARNNNKNILQATITDSSLILDNIDMDKIYIDVVERRVTFKGVRNTAHMHCVIAEKCK